MGSKKLTARNGARSSLTSSQSFTNQTCQSQVNTNRSSSNSLRRQSGDRNNNDNKLNASRPKKPCFQSPSILVTDNSGNGNSTLVHSSTLAEIDNNQLIQSTSKQSNESSAVASTSQSNGNNGQNNKKIITNTGSPDTKLNSTNKTINSINLYKLFSSSKNSEQAETTTSSNRQNTGRSASVSVSSLDKNGQSGTQLIILDGKNVRRASSNILNAASSSNPTLNKSVRSPSAGDCSNVQHVGLTTSSTLTSPLNSTANSLSAMHAGARRKSREYIRRASQVLINLTSLAPSANSENNMHGECSRRDSRLVPQITLFHCALQKLPMKDFGSEIRATMDVDQFLQQAVLLLDVNETSIEGIVNRMVGKVLDGTEPLASLKEAKTALFTHDSTNLLARTIQGTYISEGGGFDYDQSWLCATCSLPALQKRHVAIARLKSPANMGRNSHEVRFFILVLTPSKEKGTKNALETGRTFATMFADMDFRQRLLEVQTEADFKKSLLNHAQELAAEQSNPARRLPSHEQEIDFEEPKCKIAQGLCEDLRRRLSHYISDYVDGVVGHQTLHKTISTIFFLYFACLLPTIAFGVLNDNNTQGKIGDIRKAIIGQTIGGLFFGFFGGQPLVIVMTTAPLCLYIKVIYGISEEFELDFFAMYACVGCWNAFFLILYAVFDVSRLMKWCTRSTEEIFALFISIAFVADAFKDCYKNFQRHYNSAICKGDVEPNLTTIGNLNLTSTATASSLHSSFNLTNAAAALISNPDLINSNTATNNYLTKESISNFITDNSARLLSNAIQTNLSNFNQSELLTESSLSIYNATEADTICRRDSSLLFILLMLGTVWVAVSLYNFNKTPYLQASKRELLADYALPCAVILLSFIGSYTFSDIPVEHFRYSNTFEVERAKLDQLPLSALFAGMGLGFALSLLFFMDQNIAAAMVNNPCNKLKKGCAYHLDLMVVGILNSFLSMYGFPWMHGVLPHSPLHVRSLADVEERVDGGHVYEIIVKVRETRITSITSHMLIGLSIFLLPKPLAFIPTAVLDGLFLYMAITALNGNQMFERITLLFMEQAAYPPNHYIRRCPQRKIHTFTFCQMIQLGLMCFFGFSPWPYIKMVFPLIILLLLPIRHKIVAYIIEARYLEALDGEHQ